MKIAKKVAIDINRRDLSPIIERYSVIPDEWKDYPHHTRGRNSRRIIRRVSRARENYIRGNDGDAAAELGVAFHYLADEHVLLRGSHNKHATYESDITRAMIDSQFVDQYVDQLEGKNATLGYISDKMRWLSSSKYVLDPDTALNYSCATCLSVAKSVFGSKISPKLESDLIELRTSYLERMRRREEEFVCKLFEKEKKDKAFALLQGISRVERRLLRFFTFSDFRFKRNIKCYKEKRHFTGLVKSYYRETSEECFPYQDWYKVGTPQLSIHAEEVEPKLLSIDSVASEFKLSEEKIRDLKEIIQLSTIKLKDKEFIKGEDIQKITNHLAQTNMEHNKQDLVEKISKEESEERAAVDLSPKKAKSRKQVLGMKQRQSYTKKRTPVDIEAKCRKCGQKYSLTEYLENKFCRKCGTFLVLERTPIEETKSQDKS